MNGLQARPSSVPGIWEMTIMLTLRMNRRNSEVDVDPSTPPISVPRNDLALKGIKLAPRFAAPVAMAAG